MGNIIDSGYARRPIVFPDAPGWRNLSPHAPDKKVQTSANKTSGGNRAFEFGQPLRAFGWRNGARFDCALARAPCKVGVKASRLALERHESLCLHSLETELLEDGRSLANQMAVHRTMVTVGGNDAAGQVPIRMSDQKAVAVQVKHADAATSAGDSHHFGERAFRARDMREHGDRDRNVERFVRKWQRAAVGLVELDQRTALRAVRVLAGYSEQRTA